MNGRTRLHDTATEHRSRPWSAVLLGLALLASCFIRRGCGTMNGASARLPGDAVRRTVLLMDTVVEITCFPGANGSRASAKRAIDRCVTEMERLEAIFDRHRPGTFAYGLEHPPGGDLRHTNTPPEYIEVLREADRLYEITGGAFDPTVGTLLDAYGFGTKKNRVPGDAEITSLLDRSVGWRKHVRWIRQDISATGTSGCSTTPSSPAVEAVEPPVIDDCVRLELGGLAKGFIVDRAMRVLADSGARAGLVNAGGDLRAFGSKPGGRPFRIGLQSPYDRGAILGVIEVAGFAVATSGDYERYFQARGKRWHHLIDPRTGRPARALRSVTVKAPTAMSADGLATALFVLGPEKGLAAAESIGDVDAAFVTADGRFMQTRGFSAVYRPLER